MFGVLRWVVIALLLVVTLFPFYYTVLLSIRPLDAVLQDPGAICRAAHRVGARTATARCSRLRTRAGRAS